MTSFGRTFGIALILTLGAQLAAAQSLAELAKKEKERRKKLGADERAQVITDRELQGSYGGLPPAAPPPAAESSSGQAGGTAETAAPGEEQEQPDETRTREYWQKRVQDVQQRIQALEEKLQSPELNWGEGYRMDVNPLGQRNLEQRQQVERELAEARSQLEAIRDEARRANVPAGWVR